LLTPENLEKYYKKWDAIAETPEQKSYVSNLEYDIDTGVLYYTKMLDYLLENGADKAELEKIYNEKLGFFADFANGSNDVIMNLHATSLEETFGEKYAEKAEEFASNYGR
jgi:hypothetical protein